jgi:hypothetical protein
MNEHSYIRSIHRKLPDDIYKWKINDNYQAGVADAYYSGIGGDLWVEYKYVKALPARGDTTVKTTLSAQQKIWLRARHEEGRNVAVVVGSPDGHLLQTAPGEWEVEVTCDNFIRTAIEKEEIVSYIVYTTTR